MYLLFEARSQVTNVVVSLCNHYQCFDNLAVRSLCSFILNLFYFTASLVLNNKNVISEV